ncbi:hypothetical protein E4T48_02371 [Aureobasidium sp. EXF-10727]|nr:hypothetical protein E4T48_02371 [Aureobasidium sp. EXF-10727]
MSTKPEDKQPFKDSQDPKDLLASTISHLHQSGAYSDFKIVCGSDTYNAHKNIICPQSSFFRAACRPDTFQEGRTGVVTLPYDPGRQVNSFSHPITTDEFDWDLDVEDVKTVRAMIYYFYHHDYQTEPAADIKSTPVGQLLARGPLAQHARMYALGEKYGVPGLKALALRRFLPIKVKFSGLGTAMVVAFMSTPDTDQGMRDLIVEFLARHPGSTLTVPIDRTMEGLPDLVHSLCRKLLREKVDKRSG